MKKCLFCGKKIKSLKNHKTPDYCSDECSILNLPEKERRKAPNDFLPKLFSIDKQTTRFNHLYTMVLESGERLDEWSWT